MNVLIEFGSGAEDFDDEVYTELLDLLPIQNCVLNYHNKELFPSRKINKHVTQAFCASPFFYGDYSDAVAQIGEGEPVDDKLLYQLSPYENEIIALLLRWSSGGYTDIWHEYYNHIRFWNHVLDKYKIDVYFTTEVVHQGYNFILYLLCKIKGIKYFSTQRAGFPDRLHIVVDVHDQLPFFKNEFISNFDAYKNTNIDKIDLRPDILEMYEFYTGNKNRTPSYMKNRKAPKRRKWAIWLYNNFFLTKWLFDVYVNNNFFGKRIRDLYRRAKFLLGMGIRFFSFDSKTNELFIKSVVTSSIFREVATYFSYYQSKAISADYSLNYIYVPLHYQPEATSNPLGGRFVDQVMMIKTMSYYLPEGWLIYIKEHPNFNNNLGLHNPHRASWRTKTFYDELDSLTNVRFIDLNEDTYKLIDNSKAVAVITGTAGMEAITVHKPCLMFGYSYLQYAPNVFTIRNNDDCKMAMEQIEKGIDNNDIDKKIKVYFKTLENYFFEGRIVWWDVMHRPNISQFREKSKRNIVNAYIKEIKRVLGDEVIKKTT